MSKSKRKKIDWTYWDNAMNEALKQDNQASVRVLYDLVKAGFKILFGDSCC